MGNRSAVVAPCAASSAAASAATATGSATGSSTHGSSATTTYTVSNASASVGVFTDAEWHAVASGTAWRRTQHSCWILCLSSGPAWWTRHTVPIGRVRGACSSGVAGLVRQRPGSASVRSSHAALGRGCLLTHTAVASVRHHRSPALVTGVPGHRLLTCAVVAPVWHRGASTLVAAVLSSSYDLASSFTVGPSMVVMQARLISRRSSSVRLQWRASLCALPAGRVPSTAGA